jgi:hypothetical protein
LALRNEEGAAVRGPFEFPLGAGATRRGRRT